MKKKKKKASKKASPKRRLPAAPPARPKKKGKPSAPKKSRSVKPRRSVGDVLRKDISTVLVTGASGCLGGMLVPLLLREGYAVVATDQGESAKWGLTRRKRLVVREGDLCDPAFAASCLEGVDAVFHAAGQAEGRHPDAGPVHLPVKVVRTLYRAARRAGVKRFMHFSSASVYRVGHGPVSEDGPLEARNEFEQAQVEAERVVRDDAAPGLPVVTLVRTPVVYGPRCRTLMAAVAALPPVVKNLGPYYIRLTGGPRVNLVHGEDAARAAVLLLLHPKALGQVFNVADRDPMPFGDFVNHAMDAYGLKPLGPGIPYPPSTLLQAILPYVANDEIFNPLGRLSSILWQRMIRKHRLEQALEPRIDKDMLSFGSRDFVVDNRRILALGFKLKYPRFRRGWDRTVEWYERNRWIPPRDEV